MTLFEEQKYLASLINKEQCQLHRVTLVIGRAAEVLKPMLRNVSLYTMTKADEVRDFLDKFNTPMDEPIFFEDVSLMTPTVQSFLLKFIEEPLMPLIILASKDNISPIILSRCKRIIKLPCNDIPGTKSLESFVSARIQTAEEIKTAQLLGEKVDAEVLESYNNVEASSLKECPDYMYKVTRMKSNKSNIYNPDRYLELM